MIERRKPTCEYEWVPVTDRKPEPFDLCVLAKKCGRAVPGWWTGVSFEGRRLKEDDEVIAWKKADWQVNNSVYSLDPRNVKKRK